MCFFMTLQRTHTYGCFYGTPTALGTSNRVVVVRSLSHDWLCAVLWTVARQAPLPMGLSRQEHWSWLPCPPPGHHPDPISCMTGRFSYCRDISALSHTVSLLVWWIVTNHGLKGPQVGLVKNLPVSAETGSIPGWGRSPGGGHGSPRQCSCLENPVPLAFPASESHLHFLVYQLIPWPSNLVTLGWVLTLQLLWSFI